VTPRLLAAGASFGVAVGFVVNDFLSAPRPTENLIRPLLAVTLLAILMGIGAGFFRSSAVLVSVFATLWLIRPGSALSYAGAALLCGAILFRLLRKHSLDTNHAVFVSGVIFGAVALVQLIPNLSWSSPAAAAPISGDPTYLVLLDGYPRADTLAALGVDISEFLDELDARDFDHYPEATTSHPWTFATLTEMLSGQSVSFSEWDEPPEMRRLNASWRLPEGFVSVSSPDGRMRIPDVEVLNRGGASMFELTLVRRSAFGWFAGDWMMGRLRLHLDRSINAIANSDHQHVFAHLMAPHTPFLYAADEPSETPKCLPKCDIVAITVKDLGITTEEWAEGIGDYLTWLNRRVIEMVDSILSRRPDAEIVLFSDHGGRFDSENTDEWDRSFLAARTPGRPGLFSDAPHPGSILARLFP
jgi:hypothetical protein